jgi:arylformamidase
MGNARTMYDISVMLGEESFACPGDTLYSREVIMKIENGGFYNLSKVVMSAHSGTHIDAPAHFFSGAKSIEQFAVQNFIRPAHVVSIKDREMIHPREFEKLDSKPGDALLFKTHNSESGRCKSGVFSKEYVYISKEAAECCAEKKIGIVGLDYVAIDRYGDIECTSHKILLGGNIFILEGINLEAVPPGKYTLFCLPLKMKGAEASPVRAVLI